MVLAQRLRLANRHLDSVRFAIFLDLTLRIYCQQGYLQRQCVEVVELRLCVIECEGGEVQQWLLRRSKFRFKAVQQVCWKLQGTAINHASDWRPRDRLGAMTH